MSKKALVILADGTEEMEVITVIDILRRAGVDVGFKPGKDTFQVTVAGLVSVHQVKCAHDTLITPDTSLHDVSSHHFDIIVLPGGQPGSNSLASVRSWHVEGIYVVQSSGHSASCPGLRRSFYCSNLCGSDCIGDTWHRNRCHYNLLSICPSETRGGW